ncbi:hypothetical protein D8B26_001949 [Coccidioides posadasii str. Silveira]|uniref:Uncharacterized protein n=3 Tax=Coccidioides posadasii TaxID=199306 RepID=E9CX04_COCPS|nr:hypothetical protein CPC735_051700 [Coccidioides posadasii C735 delta SOWgp]EER23800.1 hypothetical protein CPC735_051700 [Coccidioides posadasii C735 delta SOWgp]EFW21830.1 conserved hypothetical protein [Coccidioides posadasii str. Silveira]KMM65287.1 hypothetical protein CPAG_01638 [Coccidioides posadasii RMSCC 3488]QVM07246.1 hypothetical protein D8B26_001949 [Coccidioides posadasii str. Silveira]|eukprot:XP_003065945.1 hypothetical protein CPC735_051700 [Coccidioides posadasii C735 delta SOWgp]
MPKSAPVEKFYLQPTLHSPNSPLPVLLYRGILPHPINEESTSEFLQANGWEKRGTWGHIATHHFHPNTHECYGIFQGSSTLIIGRGRFDDEGGVYIPVNTGDVIVLPAGTTHCSLESKGDYRYVGVYPKGALRWRNEFGRNPIDINTQRKEILRVEMPTQDPVYGKNGPLVHLWNEALLEYSAGGASKL